MSPSARKQARTQRIEAIRQGATARAATVAWVMKGITPYGQHR